MNKHKMLSILLVPLTCVGVLFGCGSSKTATSVYGSYQSMQTSYSTLGECIPNTNDGNKYVYQKYDSAKSGLYQVTYNNDEYTLTYLSDIKYDISGLDNSVINDIRSKSNVSSLNDETYNGYYAVLKIQDSILKGISNYYNNHANNFYKNIENVKVDKKEVKEFNARMDALNSATQKFNGEKKVFESSANTASWNNIHHFIFSDFSKAYNDYIEANINFVEYFKMLHIKYIIKDSAYTKDDSVGRIKDEMIFNVCRVLYMEDLKSFNMSNCYLIDLAADLREHTTSSLINNYAKILSVLLGKNTSSLTSSSTAVYDFYDETSANNTYQNSEVIKSIIIAFNQKFGLYQSVYNSVDMYRYNRARSGYSSNSVDTYLSAQSSELQSKYKFIDDFYNYTFTEYAEFVLTKLNIK